ncbi:MAG: dihydrofolate reductase family protein [Alistipes sp.]|nr:dihydrofolate reductase family protein [Alistipes sp.]
MRPYTICHMIASVDGRIDCDMTEQIEGGNEYYEALEALGCPSMMMGRVTMQMHYALSEPFVASDTTPVGREAYHIARKADGYCIGVDTHGRLQWGEKEFDGQALLVITDEKCPKAYHNRLTEQAISWIAVGENGINFARAMEILHEAFGIERLVVTGGGHINGALLEAGLLDKVSFMLAPGIDGREGMAVVFDGIADKGRPATQLRLESLKQMGETVWIRYKFKN